MVNHQLQLSSIFCIILSINLTLSYKSKIMSQNEKNIFQTKYNFRGLMAPVFTPFHNNANQTLNLEIIPEYAQFLAINNITGILVGGTTGEGTSLSIDERKMLIDAWVNAVKTTKQHLMVQIGGAALIDVKSLASYAENANVDSLLCLPDLYFQPTSVEDLVQYLKNVGESAPNTPLLYYQSTKAKNNIKADDLLRYVSQVPTFAGIKLDSSDIKEGVKAKEVNDKFSVIYGSKMVMIAGCSVGIDTFMSANLNFHPAPSIEILEFCNGKLDLNDAQKQQKFLNQMEKEIMQFGGYVESMKVAMSLTTNLYMGPARAPLKSISQEKVKEMFDRLSAMGLNVNKSAIEKLAFNYKESAAASCPIGKPTVYGIGIDGCLIILGFCFISNTDELIQLCTAQHTA